MKQVMYMLCPSCHRHCHLHPVQNTSETSERYWSSFQWDALGQIPRAVHKNEVPKEKLHAPENDDFPYDFTQCPELLPSGTPSAIHIKSTYKISENAIGNFFVKAPPRLEECPPCLYSHNKNGRRILAYIVILVSIIPCKSCCAY